MCWKEYSQICEDNENSLENVHESTQRMSMNYIFLRPVHKSELKNVGENVNLWDIF